jgi:ribonuclease-3 family protein
LHELKVKKVCCRAQSDFLKVILPILSEEELTICKRGRNSQTFHRPKSGTISQYHDATAVECLLGYIYLKGDLDRLKELFNAVNKVEAKN